MAVQLKVALENWHLTSYEPRREKPAFYICENKDADHMYGNHTAYSACVVALTWQLL